MSGITGSDGEDNTMKKSEIRLIITALASLVISVILGAITVVVFIANAGAAAGGSEKFREGVESITTTLESVVDDVTDNA